MVYIVVKKSPEYRQLTLEDLFSMPFDATSALSSSTSNTRTFMCDKVSQKFLDGVDVAKLIAKLSAFNEKHENLRTVPRNSLYYTFYRPKSSGGLRRIDAPEPPLMDALRELKSIFEIDFGALYHTSAFAYIRGRSALKAMQRHQKNESRWFAKLDMSNFFGSTTLDFVMKQFAMIFPFSEVCLDPNGREELRKALELAFYNGGLPQGTPISPLITNIMMIPLDFKLANTLRRFERQRYVYTRYADDLTISSEYDFDIKKIHGLILGVLREFECPFHLNEKKTRYGSNAGSNWNLGVMLNANNEITVGYKRKRNLKSMLFSYIKDKQSGKSWSLEDLQVMQGQHSYCRMVERKTIDAMVDHLNKKNGVDVIAMIRDDIRAA